MNDLISRTSLLRNIGIYGVSIDPYNITRLITQKILAEPTIDAADLIEYMSTENEILNAAIGQLGAIECHRDMLEHELEQVTRERDAAVKDLKLWYCFSCNNRSTPYCQECARNRVRLAKGYLAGRDHYEWRGVEVKDDDSKRKP